MNYTRFSGELRLTQVWLGINVRRRIVSLISAGLEQYPRLYLISKSTTDTGNPTFRVAGYPVIEYSIGCFAATGRASCHSSAETPE